jgi:hypothetical protein
VLVIDVMWKFLLKVVELGYLDQELLGKYIGYYTHFKASKTFYQDMSKSEKSIILCS